MTELLVEKYRPETFDDIAGNNKAIEKVKKWATQWLSGKHPKPLLLHGEPGTGKTTTAYVLAKEFGWTINQVNASDSRKSDDLEKLAKQIQSNPVTSEFQLVLLDEVDSFHGRVRYKELQDVLKDPVNPIICTANEKYKVPDWLESCTVNQKYSLGKRTRFNYLKEISENEGFDLSEEDLNRLADRPDLRSAISDMSVWGEHGSVPETDSRHWDVGPFTAVQYLLKGDDRWTDVTQASDSTFTPDEAVKWAAENVSKQWRGLEAAVAYDVLRRADVCLGQAQRIDFKYWKYANAFTEVLPDTRLTDPYQGYIRVQFPKWYGSQKSAKSDDPEARLFRKLKGDYGYRFSGSFYEFRTDILPILQNLSVDKKRDMAMTYDLDKDEMSVINLDSSDYDDWAVQEEMTEGEGLIVSQSATEW